MFRNYLITAWRHIVGNPLFSFINIFGLAVALASCTLIVLFVQEELSHDKDLPGAERIVRMHSAFRTPDAPDFLTVRSAGRMKGAISSYAPDLVDSAVRLVRSDPSVTVGDQVFNETVVFADPSFFDVFALPWRTGSPGASFRKPGDFVISESMARKYFGSTDVIGRSMSICCLADERVEVAVTGVITDLPATSHLDIDLLVLMEESMFAFAPNVLDTWTSVNTFTYFKVKPGVQPQDLKSRVWQWLNTESPFLEMVDEGMKPTDRIQPNFMAVPDLYLHARADAGNMGDMRPLGDITMVYAFIGITILVLVLAAINFMNLSTARASRRAREVALRKVLGATRRQVAMQFLGEAVTVTLIATLFALVLVELCLPAYNHAIGRDLQFSLGANPIFAVTLLGGAALVGMLAGSYPAVYLSRFLPGRILRSNQSGEDSRSQIVRNVLVVFQFAVSIALGICTAVVFAQTHFARTMDVGFSAGNKLVLHGIGSTEVASQRGALVNRLSRIPGVTRVVLSSEVPSQDNENNTRFQLFDGPDSGAVVQEQVLNYYNVGFDFFDAYDIELLEGRGFSRDFNGDLVNAVEDGDPIGQGGVVLNKAAVEQLGFSSPREALGKTLRSDLFRAGPHDLTVVGVVRNVYFRSLKFGIRASVYMHNPSLLREATISFAEGTDVIRLRRDVEVVWRELAPMTPISQEFLNGMVEAQYLDEARQGRLFAAFSLLAISIACLGLYGLASFTADRRTREIGIRKVLGARARDIVALLVWQFSRPVLVANLIAWPVAWLLMQRWLEGFEYRLGGRELVLLCALAGAISVAIAWLTVAGRAVRVARANPVDALRYE